jgi:hypothetical protein
VNSSVADGASRSVGRIPWWLGAVFVGSGFAALLYQVVWQRALYAVIGINLESVTIVVTAFLLGLGLGSVLGGRISKLPGIPILYVFSAVEAGIGLFGLGSLKIIHWAGLLSLGLSEITVAALVFGVVLLPTLLMGATLPLLVAYSVRLSGNVGRSVGWLYFVNTLGSAAAAVCAVMGLMREFGESGTVRIAASLNILAALTVLLVAKGKR